MSPDKEQPKPNSSLPENLLNSSPFLSSLLEAIGDGLWVMDRSLSMVYCNTAYRSWCNLLNFDADSLYGRPFCRDYPLYSGEEEEVYRDLFLHPHSESHTYRLQLDSEQYFQATKIPILNHHGVDLVLTILRNSTQKEHYEKIIRQQKEFYENIIEQLPVGVFAQDLLGEPKINLWNGSMEKMSGVLKEDVLDRSEYAAEVGKWLIPRKESTLFKKKLPGGRGEMLGRLQQKILYQTDGLPDSLLGIVTDETRLIRQEIALKKSRRQLAELVDQRTRLLVRKNAQLNALMESSPDVMVFSVDAEGRYLYTNQAYRKYIEQRYGISIDEGMFYVDHFTSEEDAKRYWKPIEAALHRQKSTQQVFLQLGERFPIYQAFYHPIQLENEGIIGVSVFAMDITERVYKERESLLFKTMADNAHYGVVILNPKGSILYANRYQAESHGYKPEEVLHHPVEIFHPPGDEEISLLLDRVTARGSSSPVEIKNQFRAGFTFTMLTAGILIPEYMGNESMIGLTTVDIAEQKEMENQLKQSVLKAEAAAEAKSEFIASVSHELRTPLNSIIGFSDLLSHEELSPSVHHYLEIIRKSSKSLLSLINDILDLSKMEAGKQQVQRIFMPIREAVGELEQIFELKVERKRIELHTEIDPAVPREVRMDPILFRQLLLNLMGNAVKFTSKGSVDVRLRYSGIQKEQGRMTGNLVLEVADTGIGISPEDQQRIFQPFVQSEGQDSRQYPGTGLGLAICMRIIGQLGADLRLSSQPGKGSVFTIEFPSCPGRGIPGQNEEAPVREAVFPKGDKPTCHELDLPPKEWRIASGEKWLELLEKAISTHYSSDIEALYNFILEEDSPVEGFQECGLELKARLEIFDIEAMDTLLKNLNEWANLWR